MILDPAIGSGFVADAVFGLKYRCLAGEMSSQRRAVGRAIVEMYPRVPVGSGQFSLLEIEQGIQPRGHVEVTRHNVPIVHAFADGLGYKLVTRLIASQRGFGAANLRDVFIRRRQTTAGPPPVPHRKDSAVAQLLIHREVRASPDLRHTFLDL